MTQVILQPAGNEGARQHYVDTIENPIKLSTIKNLLTQTQEQELSVAFPSGFAQFWGLTPGSSGVNIKKWEKIQQGDIVLFSRDKMIFSSGTVVNKFQNHELARHLWDMDENNQTWEYMYSVDEIKPVNISKIEFNKIVGYKENNQIQGVVVMDLEKSQKVLDELGLWSERHLLTEESELLEEAFKEIDGELQKKVETWQRAEQGHARDRLLKGRQIAECLLCGRSTSKDFLVAGHIKRRAACTDEEKRDLDNVVMLCCKFGCDEMYERGFLGVEKDGKILISSQLIDKTSQSYAENVVKKQVNIKENQIKYFEWHLEHRFRK
jgi:hypothetical protein